MNSSLSVRQAVLSDLEDLSGLFDEYRQFQKQRSDRDAARAFLKARFEHGESMLFIARDAELAVGFAQLYPSFSSVALARVFVLNDLFVNQAGRRRGAASGLLAAVESCAWALGAVRVTLNVARDNAVARQLYEARGWKRDEQYDMFHRFPQ